MKLSLKLILIIGLVGLVLVSVTFIIISSSFTLRKALLNHANDIMQNISSEYLLNLLIISKKSIIEQFEKEKYKQFTDIVYSNDEQGIFVRLLKKGKERGCIGFYRGVGSLEEAVKIAAIDAAFFDPRFEPFKKEELEDIEIEVTVLDKFIKLKNIYDFKLGIHSLLYDDYSFRGFLQAQIALEEKYSKKEFLKALCVKAGLEEFAFQKKKNRISRANTVYLRMPFNKINIEK